MDSKFVLDTVLVPSLVSPESLTGKTVVVVDVLRATTTIATAIGNGCRSVLPQPTIEAAKAKFAELENDESTAGQSLIGGERGGQIVDGFHQGNSPNEYTPEVIGGKQLILATTNGTVAMEHCRHADRVLIGAMVNLTAVAHEVIDDPWVVVMCSGTDRHITSEDVLFAGALLERITQLRAERSMETAQFTDSGQLAHNHWRTVNQQVQTGKPLADFFRDARGGINLTRIGHHADIDFAANIDISALVPELDLKTWTIEGRGVSEKV